MIKSNNYYRRKELMKSLQIPTMSEMKQELGEQLANVFFERCPAALRENIGLEPPLQGPGDDLWTSPSDLLLGKVVLKPPLTNKYIKALTHEGILQLGRDVELKFLNEMDAEKQKTLKEQEKQLLVEADRKLQQAVIMIRKEEQASTDKSLDTLRDQFENQLEEELDKLELKLSSHYQLALNNAKEDVEEQWQERLEEAIEETITNLTKKFLDEKAMFEKELMDNFEMRLKQQECIAKASFEEEQRRCKGALKALQHSLECKNIANLMYILCAERRKCEQERQLVSRQCQERVAELEGIVKEKEVELKALKEQNAVLGRKLQLREECLCEILKQFRKLIYFALKATPTQAEFLLNIEKMLTLELTRALISLDPAQSKRLCNSLMKWKDELQNDTPSTSTIEIKDHHNCLNMESRRSSVASVSDFLPAIFYRKGMYVREDFRNMISQGLTVSPGNMLWNKDVENLINIFKKVANYEQIDSLDEGAQKMRRTRSQQSAYSSVHFGKRAGDRSSINSSVHIVEQRKIRSIMSNIQHEEVLDKVQYATEDSLGLLCAKDSLTKHRESLSNTGKISSLHSEFIRSDVLSLSRCSYKGSKDKAVTKDVTRPLTRGGEVIEKVSVPISALTSVRTFLPTSSPAFIPEYIHSSLRASAPATSAPVSLNVSRKASAKGPPTRGSVTNAYSLKQAAKNELPSKEGSFEESLIKKGMEGVEEIEIPTVSKSIESKLTVTRDSIILTKLSLKPDSIIPDKLTEIATMPEEVEGGSRKNSRLSLARDSIILRKLSLGIPAKVEPDPVDDAELEEIVISEVDAHSEKAVYPLSSQSTTKSYLQGLLESRSASLDKTAQLDSRLTMHQDSLEIIRSKISTLDRKTLIQEQKTSGAPMKLVRPTHSNERMSVVTFKALPKIHETEENNVEDEPWKLYGKTSKDKTGTVVTDSATIVGKPNAAKIVGDKTERRRGETNTEFASKRINSLMDILKKDKNLLKMFTSCTN